MSTTLPKAPPSKPLTPSTPSTAPKPPSKAALVSTAILSALLATISATNTAEAQEADNKPSTGWIAGASVSYGHEFGGEHHDEEEGEIEHPHHTHVGLHIGVTMLGGQLSGPLANNQGVTGYLAHLGGHVDIPLDTFTLNFGVGFSAANWPLADPDSGEITHNWSAHPGEVSAGFSTANGLRLRLGALPLLQKDPVHQIAKLGKLPFGELSAAAGWGPVEIYVRRDTNHSGVPVGKEDPATWGGIIINPKSIPGALEIAASPEAETVALVLHLPFGDHTDTHATHF